MIKKNQSCEDGEVAAVERVKNLATVKRDNLFDPAYFVNAPTSDSARIGLAVETTIVLSLMNLSRTSGHADRVDPKVLHHRNHLSHVHWWMHEARSMLSLVVHKTTVCVWFETVHEPIFGSNTANEDVPHSV